MIKPNLVQLFGSLTFLSLSHASAQTYTTFSVPGAGNTYVNTINDNGDTAGDWSSNGVGHNFVRTAAGAITTFDVPNAGLATALSINAYGAIAGYYTDTQGVTHGFVRDPTGSFESLDAPGALFTKVIAINGGGEITGYYQSLAGLTLGFVRNASGTYTSFSVPGGLPTNANAINNMGFVAGSAEVSFLLYEAFVRGPRGNIVVIQKSHTNIQLDCINDNADVGGEVVGVGGLIITASGKTETFTVNNNVNTAVLGLNRSGTAIGNYFSGADRGFVRAADASITHLNGPGCTYTTASAINATGTITGLCITGGVGNPAFGYIYTPPAN